MPVYQVHRLRESQRQHFRWAPHTSGISTVKPRDYEPGPAVEAPSAYAAWEQLRGAGQPLQVGDLLELPGGPLEICKYIGFEEARWFVPEPPPAAEATAPAPAALT